MSFRDVARDRHGGAPHLLHEPEPLLFWETRGRPIDLRRQRTTLLPHLELSIIAHKFVAREGLSASERTPAGVEARILLPPTTNHQPPTTNHQLKCAPH